MIGKKKNQRRYVKAVESDVRDNDRLKKNHQRYVLAGESDVKDNDRLKKNRGSIA